ncbi:odorant receptor 7a-like [Culicoides brevitarsis]|uniref:odorant receptor 7a-like n=1 Tax=Culicoides brevitarsis TaxID=469753 RepID=UPI00307BF1B0
MENINQDFLDYIEIFVNIPMRMVGYNFLDDDFQPNFLTWIINLNIFSYLVINGIDIYLVSENLKSTCFCMVTYGYGFLCIGRVVNVYTHLTDIQQLKQVLLAFNFDVDDESDEREMYLKYGRVSKILGGIGTSITLGCGFCATIFPCLFLVIKGTYQLTFGFFIPGIDGSTKNGFWVNYFYQNMQIFLTLPALIGFLHAQLLFTLCACFQIDQIMIKLKKIDEQLSTVEDPCRETFRKKVKFSEILKLHQNLIKFLTNFENIYNFELGNSMFFYSVMLVITLFVCAKEVWIIGYLSVLINSYLLMIPCLYGVAVEIKSDQLINAIYDIQWYLLSENEKKLMIVFLQAAQNPKLLTYGGLLPLNLETFTKVSLKNL